MQKFTIKNGVEGSNPLVNLLLVIVAAIVIGVSVVLGFFAFLALSAMALVAAAVIGVRRWWLQRSSSKGDFIEGEFHVVKKPKKP
ncbi:MAG: hypothetical protein O2907_10240 [Proteobacteria bacterium]|nr:hypothetical protein [Pseudomonadota bacterium]MDA1064682.1 hypothetical protein [Pseudomonadota bacterium]